MCQIFHVLTHFTCNMICEGGSASGGDPSQGGGRLEERPQIQRLALGTSPVLVGHHRNQ